ncbi:PREDICTED: uncharacterized protein LOC105954517 [Erythranthe guttata]|uniref:uncharacterized protein LOC105954517 n=1 Tax=Erythranthe guttata TaxID=4155 RepID=UPI00064DB237|nr:PREDICTED: uncharacterized protein LOC105954517 [Erythranthe guttata]|eukprot:XP_012833641.1 PREDICTED: uncharacterized protein LOC105954517 [Erythranthe guttata]
MNNHREGAFLPPLLGELNYSDWKIRMKMFIKSIDEWAWRAIVIGWTPPTSMNESHEIIQTPKEKWSDEEVRIADYNSKATNAILSCIDEDQFKLISMCKSSKEAWDVLQEAYEGTTQINECKQTVAETVATVGQTVQRDLRYDNLHSIHDKRSTPLNLAGDDGDSENNSDDDVSTLEEIKQCYEKMYEKFLQVCESNKFLEKEKLVLIEENKVLKVQISTLEQNVISASRETDSLKAKFAQTQDDISKFNTGRVPVNVGTVTNECPGTCNNEAFHFDLSGIAFGALANPGQADPMRKLGQFGCRVQCTYSNIGIQFKIDIGSNANYLAFAIEFVNGDGDIGAAAISSSNSNGWLSMKQSWGATWSVGIPEGVSGPYSVKVTTIESQKTAIANNVIPANWSKGQNYRSNVNV